MLKANGMIDDAIIHTITFIGMQDEEVQGELEEHKKKLEKILRRARKVRGVDGVQVAYNQRQFIQSEGYKILDEVLPQIAIVLHDQDYFTPVDKYSIDDKKAVEI